MATFFAVPADADAVVRDIRFVNTAWYPRSMPSIPGELGKINNVRFVPVIPEWESMVEVIGLLPIADDVLTQCKERRVWRCTDEVTY